MATVTLTIRNIDPAHDTDVIDAINQTLHALVQAGAINDSDHDSWLWATE